MKKRGVPKGFRHTAETKAKVAAGMRAVWCDPEYRRAVVKAIRARAKKARAA